MIGAAISAMSTKMRIAALAAVSGAIFLSGYGLASKIHTARMRALMAEYAQVAADESARLQEEADRLNRATQQREQDLLDDLESTRAEYEQRITKIEGSRLTRTVERAVEVPGDCPGADVTVIDWSEFRRLYDGSGSAAGTSAN